MYAPTYKELDPNSGTQQIKQYWECAKGLQKVDGLTTTPYLDEVIDDTLNGKYGLAEATKKVESYYLEHGTAYATREREADIASARIAMILEREGFRFSPATLVSIHKEIFMDILEDSAGKVRNDWAGQYRIVNIGKAEDVLHGQSVIYADFNSIEANLKYDFDEESSVRYDLPPTQKQLDGLAGFVSNIWQTHPFREGNTRSIATFVILYLRNQGMNIDNQPFKDHAMFFRDALVRANFSSARLGIRADATYLKNFFENILMGANHVLDEKELFATSS